MHFLTPWFYSNRWYSEILTPEKPLNNVVDSKHWQPEVSVSVLSFEKSKLSPHVRLMIRKKTQLMILLASTGGIEGTSESTRVKAILGIHIMVADSISRKIIFMVIYGFSSRFCDSDLCHVYKSCRICLQTIYFPLLEVFGCLDFLVK